MSLNAIKMYLRDKPGWHTAADIGAVCGFPATAARVHLRTLVDRKDAKLLERTGQIAMYASPETPDDATPPAKLEQAKATIDQGKLDQANAKLEQERSNIGGAGAPYVEIVHVLRQKNFSFKQAHDWLEKKGVKVTLSGMQESYKAWARAQPGYVPPKPGPRTKKEAAHV